MANRTRYKQISTNVPALSLINFQIKPNGSSTPTIGENSGKVVSSVTRTGTGVYAIVLADTFLATGGAFTQLQLATAADTQVQITSYTVTTTKILTVTILTAGVAADITANAGNIIHFFLAQRESTAQ